MCVRVCVCVCARGCVGGWVGGWGTRGNRDCSISWWYLVIIHCDRAGGKIKVVRATRAARANRPRVPLSRLAPQLLVGDRNEWNS